MLSRRLVLPALGALALMVSAGAPEQATVVGRPYPRGVSGNPGGMSKYQRALRRMVRKQEPPKRVAAVVSAMWDMAVSGDPKGAPAAAKVYLQAVGFDMKQKLDMADVIAALKGAPDETVAWFVGVKRRMER